MDFIIERFVIKGLHKTRDYDIPIRDNTLVMVGVNGLGKTTVVNLLYLLLSRQWERVLEYDFASVAVTINGMEYVLEQEKDHSTADFSLSQQLRSQLSRTVPRHQFRTLTSDVIDRVASLAVSHGKEIVALELDRLTAIPTYICRKIAYSLNLDAKKFNEAQRTAFDDALKTQMSEYQVLYLPTYRRIEKDLSLILPKLEESMHALQQERDLPAADADHTHIELVEFGMEDVEKTFRDVKRELRQMAFQELNALAGSNLRDVIRGRGNLYDIDIFRHLTDDIVQRILNRGQGGFLDATDQSHLREVIEKLQTSDDTLLGPNDRYIAHFFSKLISVDKALFDQEKRILKFAAVCNRYLSGKELVYDDEEYTVLVRLISTGQELQLKSLSSGEKQIVSLFSHLYLKRNGKVCVIIDEPELSLSVTWQQQLLPDILDTGNCSFLAAVTHSPFIFKNQLDGYALDLSECITEATQ